MRPGQLPATAFFLPAAQGARFCLYHPPHPALPCRGAYVYAPPFAEEMNRSRRMAALQARALAAAGFGVLQIDLFGCGDSAGNAAQANWQCWKTDLVLAQQWLRTQLQVPVGLWGLRLGALLALEVAHDHPADTNALILWNPVLDGQAFLTQFLRLRLASEISERQPGDTALQTKDLRALLQAGHTLEIAGYDLSPALGLAIDARNAAILAPRTIPLHWLELVRSEESTLSAAQQRLVQQWQQQQVALDVQLLVGPAFWNSVETTISAELIEKTCALATMISQSEVAQ